MNSDRIDSPLKFPSTYPLKVIVKQEGDFEKSVIEIFRRHLPLFVETSLERQLSEGGKYVSFTVTFVAENRAQLDALYKDLQAVEEVIMVL